MGAIVKPKAVLLIVAAISKYDRALDWARQWCTATFGPVALESERFAFSETDYYTETMGKDLKKIFFGFQQLMDPEELRRAKRLTNEAEQAYAGQEDSPYPRPLNLDPGYINESKLVLASTKDHAHRLYLGEGIYAEITLRYRDKSWQPWEWTYPDYRREDFHVFFSACREKLRARRRGDEDGMS